MTTYTRSDWKARPAAHSPGVLLPENVEGIAIHWPATTAPLRGFAAVARALRSWQTYHMDGHGWSDIAYQVAVDQDGNRWILRGLGMQSAANGDQDVNRRFGAVLVIVAEGEQPTAKAIAEVRRVVRDFRRQFPKGTKIVGHQDVRPDPTACPGPILEELVRKGTFEPRVLPLPRVRAELRRAREGSGSAKTKAWISGLLALIRKGPQ